MKKQIIHFRYEYNYNESVCGKKGFLEIEKQKPNCKIG